MPITAERMQKVLDLADKSVQNCERAERCLKQINSQILELRTLVWRLNIEDKLFHDVIQSIIEIVDENKSQLQLPASAIQNLGSEQKQLQINIVKNRSAKERMRNKRQKENLEHAVENFLENKTTDEELREETERDKRELELLGQQNHPNLGPCNRDGKNWNCTKCEAQTPLPAQTNEVREDESQTDERNESQIDEWIPQIKQGQEGE